MGSRDCSVGSCQGNHERCVPMAQQCNLSAVRWRRGFFPSVAEAVAVVESLSLRCFEHVLDWETRLSQQLNLCER